MSNEQDLGALFGRTLAGLVIGVAVLLLIDGALALAGVTRFGGANGWLVAILPVWFLLEEFRARRGVSGRVAPAFVGAVLGLALGLLAAAVAGGLPPLASGAVGAAVAATAYALIWFYGIRWLGAR